MEDRVEFRRDPLWGLTIGLAWVGAGVLMFWRWWDTTYGFAYGPPPRRTSDLIFLVPILVGFGLWELFKLANKSVLVAVDWHGITDFSESDVPIPWAEVERIERVRLGVGNLRKPNALRLIIRANSRMADMRLRRPEVVILVGRLTGGVQGLRQAIARLAPQVQWT